VHLYSLDDSEFEAWHAENEAACWERDYNDMLRAEQHFGYRNSAHRPRPPVGMARLVAHERFNTSTPHPASAWLVR